MYVGTEGTDGVTDGAEADPHDADRAIPAAAATIEMILTSFILLLFIKFKCSGKTLSLTLLKLYTRIPTGQVIIEYFLAYTT